MIVGRISALLCGMVLSSVAALLCAQSNHDYDLVITNGRLINPAAGMDTMGLNIGIRNGTISEISRDRLHGRRVIDARGCIVSPGFIDILSYAPEAAGVWNKLADGVTTNLSMHGGTSDPARWYAAYEHQRIPVNFGASFFYIEARYQIVGDRYTSATQEQIRELTAAAERTLQAGALGVSFSLEYCPGTSAAEIIPLMVLAKKYEAPVFFHVRFSSMEGRGTNIDALNEVIGYARKTGAAVHIDHINSTGGTFSMKRSLALIASARKEGLDITSCTYPYSYWGTYLNSARFDPGWQKRFHISYGDLQLGGSSERLTDSSFKKYRKLGKLAVAYAIPEEDVEESLRSPFVMIGSDAILTSDHNNHPRASGTFARTLGLYAREKKVVSLMDALAKMTIMPARRLENNCSAMRRKGRISIGADADIVIFDFNTISDHATVERPDLPSSGIKYVIVNGNVALDLEGIHTLKRSGRAIKSDALLLAR